MGNVVRISPSDRVVAILTDSQTAAAGAMTGTLAAGGAGVVTYITGFTVTGLGATGAAAIEVTVNSAGSGTLKYKLGIPAGATVNVPPLQIWFDPPIPAVTANAAITVSVPSFGSGNTAAAVTTTGYQQAQ